MAGDIYGRTTKSNTDNPAGLLVSGRWPAADLTMAVSEQPAGIAMRDVYRSVTVDVTMMLQAFVGDITL